MVESIARWLIWNRYGIKLRLQVAVVPTSLDRKLRGQEISSIVTCSKDAVLTDEAAQESISEEVVHDVATQLLLFGDAVVQDHRHELTAVTKENSSRCVLVEVVVHIMTPHHSVTFPCSFAAEVPAGILTD